MRIAHDLTPAPAVVFRQVLRRLAGAAACLLVLITSDSGAFQRTPPAPAPQPIAVPAARQATNVAILTIHGPIDAVTAWSVERRMDIALKATPPADALVFELDTPGGEIGAVLEICNLIKRSPIQNTIAWINPNAYSGGAIIALACAEIVVADYATLGDALPIKVSLLGMINEMSEDERQKFLAPLLAEVVDSARRRGYDEKLVQGIVSRGVELWLVEHRATGRRLFIDRDEYRLLFGEEPSANESSRVPSASGGPAPEPTTSPLPTPLDEEASDAPQDPARFIPASPALEPLAGQVTMSQELRSERPVLTLADRGQWGLLHKVSDGHGLITLKTEDLKSYGLATATVRDDADLRAFFGASNLRRLDASWSEGLVAFLTNPIVRGVLIVIFLVSLFLEMTHPGIALPGGIAAVALVALLAPPLLINMAQWWEVAAIVLGIFLVALEVVVIPGFGVFGVLGLLMLFGGLIGTFVPNASQGLFPSTAEARNDLLYGIVTIVLSSATAGGAIYYLSRHFGSLPLLGRLVLQDPGTDDDDAPDPMFAAMEPSVPGPVRPGAIGRAVTPLRPAGRVEIGDRLVDVVADLGYIPAGASVRIISVSDFRIAVERIDAPPPPLERPPSDRPPSDRAANGSTPGGTPEGGTRA